MTSAPTPYLATVELDADAPTAGYPFDIPAIAGLGALALAPVTVLVGDNGAGKSTLVEAVAVAAGFNAEGGSRNLRFETHRTHCELSDWLVLGYSRRPRWGWFLRAETFYGMASYIENDDDPVGGVKAMFPDLHDRSHGESFLTLVESRMNGDGFYVLDEPESALSFAGQLRLMHAMHQACSEGAQFLLATHSPVLMAFPGARLYELDDQGIAPVGFDDVGAVQLWRSFLDAPDRFFRHLFAD